jgi:hypothetical protein
VVDSILLITKNDNKLKAAPITMMNGKQYARIKLADKNDVDELDIVCYFFLFIITNEKNIKKTLFLILYNENTDNIMNK